ncbi:MAG TPA: VCBS repeat-containing protein [Pirellulales bacterium]|nr:VCBS repeat-containing protein [Pirellulales bacterium]
MKKTKTAATRLGAALLVIGIVLSVRAQDGAARKELSEPIRLEAGGKPIDIESGGAAPWFGDFDGDGLGDLLVGQTEGGKLRFYRNCGNGTQPRFDDFEWFQAGAAGDAGHVIPSPENGMIGGAAGFVPQLVDFDGDGSNDVLTCAGNGGIVVFHRHEDGSFAEGETLKREDGLEILGVPGNSIHAGDWDGDGDLDLVVAIQRAGISLLRNKGSRQRPVFGDSEAFQADGEPLRGRFGSAAPVIADWDGDGLADLVVGAGDGSVTYYRHVGAAQATAVEDGRALVPPFFFDEEDASPKPGRGARPCVCDFNGDGRLDLLVGDVWTSEVRPEVKLSDEEREHDAALEKKLSALSKKFSAERKALEGDTGPARDKRLEGLRVLSNQMRTMRRALTRPPPQPIITVHGQVWVYLRSGGS